MKTQHEKALQIFESGMNCAQAVLSAYSDELEFDNQLALSISSGFGGGMGRLQATCGAATGAFMVLGIFNCKKYSDIKVRKSLINNMIQQFSVKFISLHGSMDCKSLLNCDLNTDEGQKYMKDYNLSEKVCKKCILDSISIIEDLIGNHLRVDK